MTSYRAIVVGLGGLGSAALYRLAADLGPDDGAVLGIEQFDLGHHRGASQDHSRIIRLAQHQAEYAALAAPAYKAWDEIESESGQQILTRTGGLVIEDRVAGGRDRHPQHRGLHRHVRPLRGRLRAARRRRAHRTLAAVPPRRR